MFYTDWVLAVVLGLPYLWLVLRAVWVLAEAAHVSVLFRPLCWIIGHTRSSFSLSTTKWTCKVCGLVQDVWL